MTYLGVLGVVACISGCLGARSDNDRTRAEAVSAMTVGILLIAVWGLFR